MHQTDGNIQPPIHSLNSGTFFLFQQLSSEYITTFYTFFCRILQNHAWDVRKRGSQRVSVAMGKQPAIGCSQTTQHTFRFFKKLYCLNRIREQNSTWCFLYCHWRGTEARSCKWKPTDVWLRVLFSPLSELYICCICSAVSADTSCLHPRSEVKLSAFIAHQERRSVLMWDALFQMSSLIWPGIKHVWHPSAEVFTIKVLQEKQRSIEHICCLPQ